MKRIKNILICGLGAIGGFYAGKIFDSSAYSLKILVDKNRLSKYKDEPRIINRNSYNFDYILPEDNSFAPDLIIIATKSSGLDWAIKNMANFVKDDTIILSFLNGIYSEKEIADVYGIDKVLYSFLLGHTFFRNGKYIDHDGCATIHFGAPNGLNQQNIERVKQFFDEIGVLYNVADDILNAMWNKFCFNCCANQISALTRMTFGQMLNSTKCQELMRNISAEISKIAKAEGISDSDKFYENSIAGLKLMIPDGKTSMLQDIEAGVKPEIDILGKTVIKLGEKYGIDTPYNKVLTELIELL